MALTYCNDKAPLQTRALTPWQLGVGRVYVGCVGKLIAIETHVYINLDLLLLVHSKGSKYIYISHVLGNVFFMFLKQFVSCARYTWLNAVKSTFTLAF